MRTVTPITTQVNAILLGRGFWTAIMPLLISEIRFGSSPPDNGLNERDGEVGYGYGNRI